MPMQGPWRMMDSRSMASTYAAMTRARFSEAPTQDLARHLDQQSCSVGAPQCMLQAHSSRVGWRRRGRSWQVRLAYDTQLGIYRKLTFGQRVGLALRGGRL